MNRRKTRKQTIEDIETLRLGRFAQPDMTYCILDEITDVLVNPRKGWTIHYYDNSISNYGDRLGNDDLADFPGFTDVYLRLAWSYLEPEEGRFNWEIIDRPIQRWTALGKSISFRISCCESAPGVGTPDWVRRAGAKGYSFGDGGRNWEPDYGDPVFLAKLENFLKVFAERYDDQPYISYIDIGSVGIWGEWHSPTQKKFPAEMLRKHIDLHAAYFKQSQLIMQYGASDAAALYALKKANAGLRSDSIGVRSYFIEFGGYWKIELFDKFWRTRPTVVEPEHYRNWRNDKVNSWQNGSTIANALKEHHATWLTVHHWPREWLNDGNAELARQLANQIGYWFFLKTVVYPKTVKAGDEILVQMNWENRGVAPIYKNYPVAISFKSVETGKEVFRIPHPSSDSRRWMPGKTTVNNLAWMIPDDAPKGEYILRFGLVESVDDPTAKIRLGVKGVEDDLFYKTGLIRVE